jgi:hypothetical protein
MMLNCVLTDGEDGVAPWPSNAARTSYASSYLPFRIRSRGESGRKGHKTQIRPVKTGFC